MPSLHELQQAFAASLLGAHDAYVYPAIHSDGIVAAERLRIYRNAFGANLTRALRMVYRAVDRLVGADFFDAAVEAFIAQHPPDSGDLNEYGGAFPAFLGMFTPAGGLPYLPDVARFEWALNVAATAEDASVLDAHGIAAVEPEQHALLSFTPHPSVSLLFLAYPADQIADAVLSGDATTMAQIDLASGPVHIVIHRGAQGIEAQRVDADAHEFLSRLYAGESLAALLHNAPATAPALLADELTKGRLSALRIAVQIPARNTDERR